MRRPKEERRGLRSGWWMLGAFLAGLLAIGAVVLLPGGEIRDGAGSRMQEGAAAPPRAGEDERGESPAEPGTSPSPELPRHHLAIVVDGCGYDPTKDAEWLKFPKRITLAIIPFGPSSRRLAQSAYGRDFGVLIHAPMEPEGSVSDRTRGFRFRVGMDREEMAVLLDRMIAENPWAAGVSNYMGSAFTADPASMAEFASLLKSRGMFFLDSMASARSIAVGSALQEGIPVARRDVLLEAGMSREESKRQWERAISIVKEKGSAILLCRGGRESLRTILDLVPDLEAEGIRTVTLTELLSKERTP